MDLNVLDVVLGTVLLLSVILAVRNGITRELFCIASLVVGVVLAMWGHGLLANELQPWIQNPRIAATVAFALVFVGCIILGMLIARTLVSVWSFTGLRWLDMSLGGVFGMLRGLLVCAVLLLGLIAFQPLGNTKGIVAGSTLAPWIVSLARTVVAIAPQGLRAAFKRGIAAVEDQKSIDREDPSETNRSEGGDGNADGEFSLRNRPLSRPLEEGFPSSEQAALRASILGDDTWPERFGRRAAKPPLPRARLSN